MELESKAIAANPEIKDAFDEFLRAFEAFKSANDERLGELETRSADAVTEEKVDRINRALDEQKRVLDELTLAAARPGHRRRAQGAAPAARENKAAFERYIRKGDAGGLDALELKAMSVGSDADGGYIVPLEIEQTIDRVLAKVSPMRAIATVRQIGGNVYRKPIATAGAATGWVAETGTRSADRCADAGGHRLSGHGALRHAGGDADPARRQPGRSRTVARRAKCRPCSPNRKARPSSPATAPTQPKGFLTETIVADASWEWGKLGYVASGAAGAFAATDPTDELVDLVYAPKQGYRANGAWVMNRKTESVIRKFKDSQRQLHLAAGRGRRPAGRRCSAIRWPKPRTCPTSPRIPIRSRSAISPAAI